MAHLGIDVGKRPNSACALDAGGEVVFRADLENRPGDIDRLLDRAGARTLWEALLASSRSGGALPAARASQPACS